MKAAVRGVGGGKQVLFMMVLALIILPMNLILNATTPRLFKATCSPCLKRLMYMRQNRRALCE
ncbi:hypothetical protein AMQ83_14890 [Paenibacillus riograndensis]|nr:hypothetical protein AMQ83_14890 [Paenibacillus riograndensis]